MKQNVSKYYFSEKIQSPTTTVFVVTNKQLICLIPRAT